MVHAPERTADLLSIKRHLLYVLTISAGAWSCGRSKVDSGELCPRWQAPVAAGTVDTSALDEASGLVASARRSDLLWTHNDDGDEDGVLFAVSTDGAVVGTLTLRGAGPVDWEAVSTSTVRGSPELLVGDIGDNDAVRESIAVLVTAEPDEMDGAQDAALFERVSITLPDGPMDAEAMLVDPSTGRLLIVTRAADRAVVYAADWTSGGHVEAERVAELDLNAGLFGGLGAVRAADVTADGAVVLRFTDGVVWFPGSGSALDAVTGRTCAVRAPAEADGEGVATAGSDLYFLGEGAAPTLWKVAGSDA